ncbi:SIS domain-containing protein [Spiroplasma endosymbiont of Crioceris asparagi]|uniref:SIS domain-containing protein n=1 Tax=Spiroplasma endosymbiont of Crioceris asparagi TaxID=3066286 RepID=UPI0030CB7334
MEKHNFILLGVQLNQFPMWGLFLILFSVTLVITIAPWTLVKNKREIKKQVKKEIINKKIEEELKEKKMIFNYTEQELEQKKGIHTLKEIEQQPVIWNNIIDLIQKDYEKIDNFLNKNLTKDTRIIFSGAGTSEFIGNTLYPYFIEQGFDVQSVSTTDIVLQPKKFLSTTKRTLLVSFARSGNSPESVATFNLANQCLENVSHLIITCNKEGKLANIKSKDNVFIFLLPEESNDVSFAMTSSFTGMLCTALLILDKKNYKKNLEELKIISKQTKEDMQKNHLEIKKIANIDNKRITYLGSNSLKGIAQEAHLKVLELSAGDVTAFFNSPTGFRHGPKSILNKDSIVLLFMSNDEYTRNYDKDMINELYLQKQINKLVVFDYLEEKFILDRADVLIKTGTQKVKNDILQAINYIAMAQLYGFYKSLFLNKTPDNPCPTGEVNRVVKGVIIHDYKG